MGARRHTLKVGGSVLIRYNYANPQVFGAGEFTFGELPGSLLSPALASTTITALQAFNLGLAETYQQGFGNDQVFSTNPFYSVFAQDSWKVRKNLKLDFGLRYELDTRRPPIRNDTNNVAPRFAFAWDPFSKGTTVVRGGYGIYYSPIYYQIDYVVNALGEVNGYRQVAQVFTSIQTPGPAAANNIFRCSRPKALSGSQLPNARLWLPTCSSSGFSRCTPGLSRPFRCSFKSRRITSIPIANRAAWGLSTKLRQARQSR